MKRLLLLFLHFPVIACSQISLDFESGSLDPWKKSRDSAWCITDANVLSGAYSLWHCLDDTISGEDRISFAYDSLELSFSSTSWQFKLRHAYLPSSSNKWAVFLLSDQDEREMRPGGNANSIVLGVNFKGSDDILKLWRIRISGMDLIAETNLNWQEEVGTESTSIKAERSSTGEWQIFIDHESKDDNTNIFSGDPVEWQLIGLGLDSLPFSPEYFGIYYRFSSKQDRKLWLDDIWVNGTFKRDTTPPTVNELKILNENSLRIIFSEAIDKTLAVLTFRYSYSELNIQPDSAILYSDNTIDLVFGDAFKSGRTEILRIDGIPDQKGNVSDILEEEFTWFRASWGDILISEVLYDPEPVIGLPGYEYLEIYNRSDFTIGIEGWVISTGTKHFILPGYNLPARTYLLLCYKGSGDLYSKAVRSIAGLSSRTMFLNEGSIIYLYDRQTNLIDWMEYTPALHKNEYYGSGGWSLERIDLSRNCHSHDNWTSSIDKLGGTPGKENSVKRNMPDQNPPEITSVYLPDPTSILIEFNETMNFSAEAWKENWRIPGRSVAPDSVFINSPFNDELRLVYGDGFEIGKDYFLDAGPGIEDCSGNPIVPGSRYRFAIPVMPEKSEILISEVLFNPLPFCPDFVEIYNPGPKTFDLSDIALANRDAQTNEISSAFRVMQSHHLFSPKDYIVFTEDAESLGACYTVYSPACIIEVKDMPAMGDNEGSLLVLDKYLELIDELNYNKNMHHAALPSGEGVSLERISFMSPSWSSTNWHSASSNDGYGTPGRENSQHEETDLPAEGIELEPEIFTPDMDGVNDKLFIKYHFKSHGLTVRILILDPRGRLIKDITGKQLLGTEGFFIWDGTDRYGEMARTGIYLVYTEVSGGKEGVRKFKNTCVLSKGR